MTSCNQSELDNFIEKVRELADRGLKLALLPIDEEGRLAEDLVTFPAPKASSSCSDPSALLPPLDIPASKIKQVIAFSFITYENSPAVTQGCGPNAHGQHTCYPPFGA